MNRRHFPEAYSWHEEEEAYRRYMREGMAERERQKQQHTRQRFGGGGDDGGGQYGGGGDAAARASAAAAEAQQRATRMRDEAAQRTLDEERRKDEAWRAKLASKTKGKTSAAAAAAGPSPADYRRLWGKAMAGTCDVIHNTTPYVKRHLHSTRFHSIPHRQCF